MLKRDLGNKAPSKKKGKRESSSSSSSSDSSSSDSSSSSSSSAEAEKKSKRKKAASKTSKSAGGASSVSPPTVAKAEKSPKAKAATKIQSTFRGHQTRRKSRQKSPLLSRSASAAPKTSAKAGAHPTAKSSKVASPLVAGKQEQAATKIQKLYRGNLARNRPKSTSPTRSQSPASRRASLFSKIDTNGDGIITRSDFKKAVSAGMLDGAGMKAKMRTLEEETQKLRQMLAATSSPGALTNASTTASTIPRLDFKGLQQTPSEAEFDKTQKVLAKRPPRPNSASKKKNPQQGSAAAAKKTKGSKPAGDEDRLQEWLMDHVDTPEKQEELVKQFRKWAVPSTKKKKLRPWKRSKSSSPPRKTSPNGGGTSTNQRNARTPSPNMKVKSQLANEEASKTRSVTVLHRSQSMEPHRPQSAQMQATLQRSRSSEGNTFGNMRASRRHSPDSNRKRKIGQEVEWSDFSKSPRSESVERWTRWKKPHERETFEIVAEYGVVDIGFSFEKKQDGSVLVGEVLFGSWGWRKGVEEDDQLLEVDDKKVSELSEAQVRWSMMRRPVRLAFLSNLSRKRGKGDGRSASSDAKGKGKKKGKGKGRGKKGKLDEHDHTWGTDLAKATPRNWNNVVKGQPKRSDTELVHVTPDDVIRFAKSPLTAALTGSFKIINRSEITVAFKVKTTAPKNYHIVQPTKGILTSKKVQAVRLVFKPRGMTDLLQPEYSIVVQVTRVNEEEGEGLEKFDELEMKNPMLELAKNPVVEEHRLLVIFEDSDRCRPVDLSNTGFVSYEDSSFACPSRMNLAHTDTLDKREDYRQKKKQEQIDEFENTIKWPTKRAPSAEVLASAERLHGDNKRKYDKRERSAQEAIEKEKKALTTVYNASTIKFSEVGTERLDRNERQFWLQRKAHETERMKNEEEEFKKIADKSVHINGDVSHGQEGTDRLYQEGLERMARKEAAVEKELDRQEAETSMYIAPPGSVNVDELLNKLLNDGKEDKEKIEKKRNEELDKAKREAASMGLVNAPPERQMQALQHAHALSATWKKHERFRVLLQARYQEAEAELIKHQSVGHEVPPDWNKRGLLDMVDRLYPHNDVKMMMRNKQDAAQQAIAEAWSKPRSASPHRQRKDAVSNQAISTAGSDAFEDGEIARSLDDPRLMGTLVDEGVAQALSRPTSKKTLAQPKSSTIHQKALNTRSRQVASEAEGWKRPLSPRSPSSMQQQHGKSAPSSQSQHVPRASGYDWDYWGGDTEARERNTKRSSARPHSPRSTVSDEALEQSDRFGMNRKNSARKTGSPERETGKTSQRTSPDSDTDKRRSGGGRTPMTGDSGSPSRVLLPPRESRILEDDDRYKLAAIQIQRHTRGMLARGQVKAINDKKPQEPPQNNSQASTSPKSVPVIPKLSLPGVEERNLSKPSKSKVSKASKTSANKFF